VHQCMSFVFGIEKDMCRELPILWSLIHAY